MLLGLSSTLALTDEQFISESIHMVFSEFSISVQISNLTSELRHLGFLQNEEDLTFTFPNEAYYKKCALRAVRLWITVFGVNLFPFSIPIAKLFYLESRLGNNLCRIHPYYEKLSGIQWRRFRAK